VREAVRPRQRAALAAAAARFERTGLRAWTVGSLPRAVTLAEDVRAYPALVDEGETAGVRVLDTPEAQRAAMQAGTRRLLLLTVPSPRRHIGNAAQLALAARPGLIDDVVAAAVDALAAEAGGPAWDEAGFARLRDHVAGHLADRTNAVAGQVARILAAVGEVEELMRRRGGAQFEPARLDVARQLGRLVHPGFVTAAGVERLPDIERYLQAAARRLERLPDAVATDRDRMNAVHELEELYRRRLNAGPPTAAVREARWMLEELRVSHFAQSLGTRGPVSSKRIRRLLS
jgi:ATP-dependent helicase HrpA